MIDFFLDLGRTKHSGLLGFPNLFQVGVFLGQLGDFLFDQAKSLLGSLVLFFLDRLALDLELDDATIQLVHHFRLGIDFHLDAGRSFVDQVDGLVRQEAIGDVAMAQLGGSNDGRVGDIDAVVQLVLFLQAAQDGDGRFDARLLDQHLLETTLQCGILLDVLAVFVQRRRADAVQFATGQGRLQHVAGVDGTFGLAGADHGVQFVDEQDDASFVLRHFLEDRLQAFLELAAILGAGQQAGHVEDQHLLALQGFRHFFIDDTLGQPLDDGRLANTRLADQHRVVLGAALQDLDGAADFIVATDDRVEFPLSGAFGQIDAVFLQRLALTFSFLRIDPLSTTHGHDRRFDGLAGKAVLLGNAAGFVLVVAQGEQEHLAGDELVATLLRFLVGQIEQVVQVAANGDITAVALDLRQTGQRLFKIALQAGYVNTGARQQRGRSAVILIDQGEQQVLRFDELLVAANGQTLGIG